MPEETYRIGELVKLAEVTRRTVHYYVNKGLIPPAKGTGVNSYYTTDHLNRIKLIRKLQESFLPLDEIRRMITPLEPAGVVEQLEQYAQGKMPFNKELLLQETKGEKSDQPAAGRRLYERVDLGGDVELHYPVELGEKEPALLSCLIESTMKILQSHKTPGRSRGE